MKRKSISISQFEKNQINHATFKRNKMYLDFDKLQNNEKDLQIRRRQPQIIVKSPKSQSVNNKIQNSFRNSVKQLKTKLQEQTKRFRQRVLNSPILDNKIHDLDQTKYQTQKSYLDNPELDDLTVQSHQLNVPIKNYLNNQNQSHLRSQNKIKGIPIDKQITRDYLHRYHVQRNYSVDQRNFDNFYITKHDLSKTQDFKKLSPRNISFIHQHLNDLNYNTQKTYQNFYFSNKPMKTTFKLSLQNNKIGRKFYEPVKEQNVPKTDLDPQKLRKSFTQTTCFKPNKIDSFYKMTSRNLPHQLDQRNLSPINNFYKDQQGRIIKQKVDYAVKKMYDDLIRKQKEDHYKKKNPQFTRNEICDQRYFKQMIKRQNKNKKLIGQ